MAVLSRTSQRRPSCRLPYSHLPRRFMMYRTGVGRTVRMLFALAISVATFAGHGIALVSAEGQPGAVYALSNAAAGNTVVVWNRASDGTLSLAAAYPTAGLGTGAGLGSQGALIRREDTRWRCAVNAGR